MTNKKCQKCRLIIIEDWSEWLEDNPDQEYIQCNYCFHLEKIR